MSCWATSNCMTWMWARGETWTQPSMSLAQYSNNAIKRASDCCQWSGLRFQGSSEASCDWLVAHFECGRWKGTCKDKDTCGQTLCRGCFQLSSPEVMGYFFWTHRNCCFFLLLAKNWILMWQMMRGEEEKVRKIKVKLFTSSSLEVITLTMNHKAPSSGLTFLTHLSLSRSLSFYPVIFPPSIMKS